MAATTAPSHSAVATPASLRREPVRSQPASLRRVRIRQERIVACGEGLSRFHLVLPAIDGSELIQFFLDLNGAGCSLRLKGPLDLEFLKSFPSRGSLERFARHRDTMPAALSRALRPVLHVTTGMCPRARPTG